MQRHIAVIDMPFHKKTKSCAFFLDLLRQSYGESAVDIFYDNTSEGGTRDLGYIKHKDKYDTIIFWQMLPSAQILYRLKDKNILYVPMYDDFHAYRRYLKYLKDFSIKVLSFSLRIHNFVQQVLGLESLYIQYYPPVLAYDLDYTKKNIFWWYRGAISWENIKKILGRQHIHKLTIKNVPDPHYNPLIISNEDIVRYNIHIVDTFYPNPDQHYTILSQHNIFIAPRRKEGIGMSFLDALRIGMCVVGYDDATMSEYIEHGKDGLLTDFLGELNLDLYATLGNAAKRRYAIGYKERQQQEKNIIQFIEKKCDKIYIKYIPMLYNSSLYYIGTFVANMVWKIKLFLRRLYR